MYWADAGGGSAKPTANARTTSVARGNAESRETAGYSARRPNDRKPRASTTTT
jgi:hypothetical protein